MNYYHKRLIYFGYYCKSIIENIHSQKKKKKNNYRKYSTLESSNIHIKPH